MEDKVVEVANRQITVKSGFVVTGPGDDDGYWEFRAWVPLRPHQSDNVEILRDVNGRYWAAVDLSTARKAIAKAHPRLILQWEPDRKRMVG